MIGGSSSWQTAAVAAASYHSLGTESCSSTSYNSRMGSAVQQLLPVRLPDIFGF
jgi:hypothetical protein